MVSLDFMILFYLHLQISMPGANFSTVNNDDFISRLRLLKYGREKVVTNLGNLGHEEENPYSVY